MNHFEKYKDRVHYQSVIGSRAYGLATPESDKDVRGIFIPSLNDLYSLDSKTESIEDQTGDNDLFYFSLYKVCILALNANPNVLEILYSPMVEKCTDEIKPLIENRNLFLSKRIFKSYSGYAMNQYNRLKRSYEDDLKTGGSRVNRKHAMHTIRLLLAGIHALKYGEILVDMSEHREFLLDIRNNKDNKIEDILGLFEVYDKQFIEHYDKAKLPKNPNYKKINDIVVGIYKDVHSQES